VAVSPFKVTRLSPLSEKRTTAPAAPAIALLSAEAAGGSMGACFGIVKVKFQG
jgi:hypothetical protein